MSGREWWLVVLAGWAVITFVAALLHYANWLTFAAAMLMLVGWGGQYLWEKRTRAGGRQDG